MEKVRITRKQADAIELTRAKGTISQEIIQRYFHNDLIQVNGYIEISNMPLDILIRSLYIGYEVEETPEDKVREYIKECQSEHDTKAVVVAHHILKLLNIKIEEIN